MAMIFSVGMLPVSSFTVNRVNSLEFERNLVCNKGNRRRRIFLTCKNSSQSFHAGNISNLHRSLNFPMRFRSFANCKTAEKRLADRINGCLAHSWLITNSPWIPFIVLVLQHDFHHTTCGFQRPLTRSIVNRCHHSNDYFYCCSRALLSFLVPHLSPTSRDCTQSFFRSICSYSNRSLQ